MLRHRVVVGSRFVQAWAGSVRVAFAIDAVQEVLAPRAVTRLFHAPKAVLGVVNLRGDILPVIDLAALLGDAATRTQDPTEERLLVVRATIDESPKPVAFAVRVSRLDPLRDAGTAEIAPLPAGVPERASRIARGIVGGEGPTVLVLDPSKLVSIEEVAALR